MKYEFCEENEVVIQVFLASQLRQLFDLKASRSGFCRWRIPFSQYFLDKRDKRKSRRFYLRIYHVFHICVLNNRPPVSEHQTKKGSMTVSFPKTWKFNHFLCLILSSLRKMSETASATPSLWKKVSWWQFNKTTEFATWEFFFEKEALDPKTPFLEGWALLLWL